MMVGCGSGPPEIEDIGLRRHLWSELNKPRGSEFTKAELQDIIRFDIDGPIRGEFVTGLKGIEHLTNLNELSIVDNDGQPLDVSALSKLKNLKVLYLREVGVTDLKPLAELKTLTELDIEGTPLSNLEPLAELSNLTRLRLFRNNISDVTPLAGLSNLEYLNLERNPIRDISPLADMTKLKYLNLTDVPISDISVVAGFPSLQSIQFHVNFTDDFSPLLQSGLGEGAYITLWGEWKKGSSGVDVIKALIARGVTCSWECMGLNP